MFKFGFSEDDSDKPREKWVGIAITSGWYKNVIKIKDIKDDINEDDSKQLTWFPAAEVKVTPEQIQEEYSPDDYTETQICGIDIRIIRSDNVVVSLTSEDHENIVKAESQHSDLLPAVYEGGLKIWECSYDLGRYVIESGVQLEGKKILDLGCGAGLVGLLTLLRGSSVHFQDYNAEVIKLVTIPNVLLNFEDRRLVKDKCEFYCGDWESFTALSSKKYVKKEDKYDFILTSETIYNPANQTKLYEVFKRRLKDEGVGYIAGKTYYFGVGGGMRQFETLVKDDKIFDVEIVWKSTEGLQREIMMLKRRVC